MLVIAAKNHLSERCSRSGRSPSSLFGPLDTRRCLAANLKSGRPKKIERIRALVAQGASAFRATAALNRKRHSPNALEN
jgi:hypothetical protein